MARVVVFGSSGRAGRAAVAEATARGHDVTALTRETGDVADASAVARAARGQDMAIVAVYDANGDPSEFYRAVARALLDGLEVSGIRRLVWVGLSPLLADAEGRPARERYPAEHAEFIRAHAAVVDALTHSDLPWVAVSPSGDFDHGGKPVGGYRIAPGDPDSRITYTDLALALLDEAERPEARRSQIGVEGA